MLSRFNLVEKPIRHCAALSILFTLAVLSSDASAQDRVGLLSEAIGRVTLQRDGGSGTIEPADPLIQADVLSTSSRGFASLAFDSGWNYALAAGSQADLTWSPPNTIFVTNGAIWGVSKTDQTFRVESGVAVAIAPGTAFYLSVAGDGATTILVTEGEVRFANRAGVTVTVPAGLASAVAADGGPPSPPAPPTASVAAAAAGLSAAMAAATTPAASIPNGNFETLRARRGAAETARRQSSVRPEAPDGHGKGE